MGRSQRDVSFTVASRNFGLPIIPLPGVFEFTRYGDPCFAIQTAHGPVSVEWRCSKFKIFGNILSLESLDLVRMEWLPGAPGCGTTMQTIGFDANGPRAIFPKGQRPKIPHLHITRRSKSSYLVEIAATEHQVSILQQAAKERKALIERERANIESIKQEQITEEYRAQRYSNPEKFRRVLMDSADTAKCVVMHWLDEGGRYYRFDDKTLKRIESGFLEISKALADGVVISGKRRAEENVIFIK